MVDDVNSKTERDRIQQEINDLTFFGPVGELETKLTSLIGADKTENFMAEIEKIISNSSRLRTLVNSSFQKIDELER